MSHRANEVMGEAGREEGMRTREVLLALQLEHVVEGGVDFPQRLAYHGRRQGFDEAQDLLVEVCSQSL